MIAVATLILVAGMVDDMRSRKVHNSLVVSLFVIASASSIYFRGFHESLVGVGAMLLALIITLPLFTTRILGGGDVKLFSVFALAVDPTMMFWTLVYSFFWGALFGVTHAAMQKQLVVLVRNTYRIASRRKTQPVQLQKIPYTFALLLGWLTQLTFMRVSGMI